MINQTAQGLASLGRGNDSMLVHMTPREVQGLQGLAMAHGGSLTINPQTGLPEAGFLDAVLPMAAGFALGPGGFGLFQGANAALMAGLTVGGLTALASGDIGKGIMAGFGAYGGSGLGDAIKSFGSQAAKAGSGTTGEFVGDALAANKMDVMHPTGAPGVNVFSGSSQGINLPKYTGASGFGPSAVGNTSFLSGTSGADALNTKNLLDLGAGSGTTSATNLIRPGVSSMPLTDQTLGQGFSNVMADPSGFAKEYGPGKLALQGGSLALEALKPEVPQEDFYTDPEKGKWRSSTGGLSLGPQFDTRLRLAEGGEIKSYAVGGVISNPSVGAGISDLYNRPEGQTMETISNDGYGIGRLNTLGSEQAKYQAQTLGYADGGDVGMNIDKLPSLNVNTGQQIPAGGLESLDTGNPVLDKIFAKQIMSPSRGGMIDNPLYMMRQAMFDKGIKFAAKGGYLDGDGDGMSDSIPATIEGKQPARLADGEFVVPADVVSHLGNGSSKAGSKRLYAMLDKVRQARTGTKKQGKEIKAEKYMPA